MQSQSGRMRISAYPQKIFLYIYVFCYFAFILLLRASYSGHLQIPSSSRRCRVGRAAGEENSIIHSNAVKSVTQLTCVVP